ncbi:hypothetical protein P4V74_30850 [Bacillus thuringiensis]|uniref:hypothetical protein n=1 Tax=Bacillus thuringiensis TaxID=1428 RepID=UPI00159484A6|nr:hypothetical protein [Bacillus thuringiensis]MED2035562.1 hypothetical protein [Bacillus thuringiensis]
MERYREILLADVFELISRNKVEGIYFKNKNGTLLRATDYNWGLNEFTKIKFFKHEVIE